MGRYHLSRLAREDISEIVASAAADSIQMAIDLNDRLEPTLAILGNNPDLGRDRPEIFPMMRSFRTGANVLFYEARDGEIVIVRLLPAGLDLDKSNEHRRHGT